eukprot:217425-Pelagomonas_calceolata.AAC.1
MRNTGGWLPVPSFLLTNAPKYVLLPIPKSWCGDRWEDGACFQSSQVIGAEELVTVGGSMMMRKYRDIATLTRLRSLTLTSGCCFFRGLCKLQAARSPGCTDLCVGAWHMLRWIHSERWIRRMLWVGLRGSCEVAERAKEVVLYPILTSLGLFDRTLDPLNPHARHCVRLALTFGMACFSTGK